ncbi:hypothetical protein FRB95_002645 [Tulasnella sp. JGI-2019a]|nr:hypothetical protein FRB95_002645 [Tulasnella sp. JGI-2019a]
MEHLFPMLRAIIASCHYIQIELGDVGVTVISGEERILEIRSPTVLAQQNWPITITEGPRNLFGTNTVTTLIHLAICMNIRALLPLALPLLESSCPIEELELWQRWPDKYTSDKLGEVLELL